MEEKRSFVDEAKVFASKAGKAVISGAKKAIKPTIYAAVTFAIGAIGYQAGKNDWFGSLTPDPAASDEEVISNITEMLSDISSEAEVTNF